MYRVFVIFFNFFFFVKNMVSQTCQNDILGIGEDDISLGVKFQKKMKNKFFVAWVGSSEFYPHDSLDSDLFDFFYEK